MEVTTYTSSDGTEKVIAEMNNFNLVHALLTLQDVLSLNPNGFGDATEDYERVKAEHVALKAEIFKRLDTRPKEEGTQLSITVPISESDLQDLQNGEEFDWNFSDHNGKGLVNVKVRPEVDEDKE